MKSHPLLDAAHKGDLEAVRAALAAGEAIDGVDEKGRTALRSAVVMGHVAVAEALLDAGAKPDAHSRELTQGLWMPIRGVPRSPVRATLMHDAARMGGGSMIALLAKRGFDVNAPDEDGDTPLFYACRGGIDAVRALLAAGALPDAIDGRDHRPIEMTADHEVVVALIEAGVSPNGRPGREGTALVDAARYGREETVVWLLAHGALPNREGDRDSALGVAAGYGHPQIVRSLLDAGAVVDDLPEADGALRHERPPISKAARAGHAGIVEMLIAAGSRELTAALISAAENGHDALVIRLLDAGAAIDGSVGYGGPALTAAASYGHLETARLLLSRGADVNGRTQGGETPYTRARDLGILSLLREHGAQYAKKPGKKPAAKPAPSGPRAGRRVTHPTFGEGTITAVEGSGDAAKCTVRFDGTPAPKKLVARVLTLITIEEPALDHEDLPPPPKRTEDELRDAILAAPWDDGPRLVWADFLLERNASDPRGELVVLQCEIARLAPGTPRAAELVTRQEAILVKNEARWVGDGVRAVSWKRGILERVEMTGQSFVNFGAALLAREPVERLAVSFPDGLLVEPFAATRELTRLRTLELHRSTLKAPDLERLASSRNLANLESVSTKDCTFDPAAEAVLAAWRKRIAR